MKTKSNKSKEKLHIVKANGQNEDSNLFSAGININIPTKTWFCLAAAILIPAIIIIVMLTIKDNLPLLKYSK